MKSTLCFGEIMARFSPPHYLRLGQAMPGSMEVAFAGAEANTAVAIAQFGGTADFLSALPLNPIGDAALNAVRSVGVGVEHVVRSSTGRCGLYFVETGASQRGGVVVYDREGSTFSLLGPESYPWENAFKEAAWFHTTGIAAGVSRIAAEATEYGVRQARSRGLTVSCDLNFRRKLWRWDPARAPEVLARRTLTTAILPHLHVLIGNVHDLAATIDERFPESADETLDSQIALAARIGARFPNLTWIAMTLRCHHSASHHGWGALLFRVADGAAFGAPQVAGRYAPYEIHTIVDRVGTGDVFAGALIYSLQTRELSDPARAVRFAAAASCLAHAIKGDFFCGTRAEVEALMNGDGAGFLSR